MASVQRIQGIHPIEDADAIEVAKVNGWNVVVKRGEFNPGQDIIYFEIDSFLVDGVPAWQFLVDKNSIEFNGLKGHVLKTVRLRGQLSQGLILSLNSLGLSQLEFKQGDDLTDVLKIQKYEPPIPECLVGQVKGMFPSFIKKTEQERIQNIFDKMAAKYRDVIFEATMKLDGNSMTAYLNNKEIGVCSRGLDLKINEENQDNAFIKVFKEKGIEDFLKYYGRNIAVQGEVMGPGICGNREKFSDHEFFLFDVYDIDRRRHMTPDERSVVVDDMIRFGYSGSFVPNLGYVKVFDQFSNIDELLKASEIRSINHKTAEGIVYRSNRLINDEIISFKVISNKYLMS